MSENQSTATLDNTQTPNTQTPQRTNSPGGLPKHPLTEYIRIDEKRGRYEINKRVFTDEAVFKRERELIFSKCWLYLGHESEIKKAKDYITRHVGGRHVIFNRDRNGKIHAFENVCMHRGTTLEVRPSGNSNVFTCPYHGWVFDGEGKLRNQSSPLGGGYDEDFNADGRYDLVPVARLEHYRGLYFVNFNPKAVDLIAYLGASKDYLDLIFDQDKEGLEVVGGSQHLVNGGNWKVLTDNLVDAYHGNILHSTYFEFVTSRTLNPNTAATFLGFGGGLGNGHNFWESTFAVGRPIAHWIPAFGEETKPIIEAKKQELVERFGEERAERIAKTSRNMTIFPNMMIVDNVSISIRTMYPESADRVHMNIWAMAPTNEPDLLRRVRLDNHLTFTGPAGFAHPDDYEVFERMREGNHTSSVMWQDYSKGMKIEEIIDGDRRKSRSDFLNESQQRAWWTQWDRIMAGAETLE
jgi:p-cumate 2,3-dioxygenase alpha subunit